MRQGPADERELSRQVSRFKRLLDRVVPQKESAA